MRERAPDAPSALKRVGVTGATSDFAAAIIPRLLADPTVGTVRGISRGPARLVRSGYDHIEMDVRDGSLAEVLAGCNAVIHLAFIVEEIHDKNLTRSINVDGSINVVESCAAAGVRQLVVASSVNAYGAPSPTAAPLDESTFPRGDRHSYYAHDKALVEHYLEWWQRRNPDSLAITVLRPTYIVGPDFHNDGIAAFCGSYGVIPNAGRSSFQFLHQQDLADAFALVLRHQLTGTFNVAPDDRTPIRQLAAAHGQRLLSVSADIARPVADALFALRLSSYSGEWVAAGEPVADSSLLQQLTEWRPTLTSNEAAAVMLIQQGRRLVDPGAALRRGVACEAALAVATDQARSRLVAADQDPVQLDNCLSSVEHLVVPVPGGGLVHAERHRRTAASPAVDIILVPEAGRWARFYTHLADHLASRGRVTIVDRPGTGLSVGPRRIRRGSQVATAIREITAAPTPERPVCVLVFGDSTAARRSDAERIVRRLPRQAAVVRTDPYSTACGQQLCDLVDKLLGDSVAVRTNHSPTVALAQGASTGA